MRPRPLLSRLVAAITALTTVLCLGCTGFEPMIDAMHGAPGASIMACAANSADSAQAAASVPVNPGHESQHLAPGTRVVSALGQSGTHAPYDCGCQSCTAPSVAAAVVHALHILPMHAQSTYAVYPALIFEQPLVPPPERAI